MKSLTKLAILAGTAGGLLYTAAKKNVLQISPEKIKEKTKDFTDKVNLEISSNEKASNVINKAQEIGKDLKDGAQQFVKENINPDGPLASSIEELKETLASKLNDLEPVHNFPADWVKLLKIYEDAIESGKTDDIERIGSINLNHEELLAQFTLWAFLGAPLNIESDIDSSDENKLNDLLNIVSNEDVLKIKEDILNNPPKRIKFESNEDIILKPLYNDEFAICMFNKTNELRIMELNLQDAVSNDFIKTPKSDSYEVYDLFTKEIFPIKDDLLKYVLPHGVRAFKVKAKIN